MDACGRAGELLLRLLGRVRTEDAFTLIEMLTVMVILSIVMTGITAVFIQGSNAELDMNNRFQAQMNARLGLDRMRKDIHCSSAVTTHGATSVTFTDPCINASPSNLTWCTATVGGDIGLYRALASTCSAASPAVRQIDRLTTPNVFTYQAPWIGSLALVYVKLPVNTASAKNLSAPQDTYTLCDGIVLRNSTRVGAGSYTASPC